MNSIIKTDMVVRGKIRGNGSQLAAYLLRRADNDNVKVFDIRGTCQPHDLRKSLLEMSLTSELTKSDCGLYHAQINPRPGEDKRMTAQDWLRAVEILEEETGFTGQKRIMVMHEKKGRLHMHVAWERYDHETGIMKSDSFSRLAQDRARVRMEQELEQQRTPHRNKHRPDLKKELTELWFETSTAQAFIEAAESRGYRIAAGTQRPYMVVDQTGTSFNLVKQISGVRTKDVGLRFKGIKLMDEKQAIQAVRNRQEIERQKSKDAEKVRAAANDNAKPSLSMSARFQINHTDAEKANQQLKDALRKEELKRLEKEKIIEKLRKAREFRDNERDMGR